MKKIDDILKLITGNMDNERKREIYSSVRGDADAGDIYKKAKLTWALMSSTKKMPDYKVEESYRMLHARISTKHFSLKLHSYFRYVAVLMAVLGISTLTFYFGKQNSFGPSSKLKYTSVVTDKGQISKVILPDSSIVWLNSGSTLTYDNNYSFNNRDLKLSGQAFLEVKKNKNLPLVVASGNLMVKVLGTRFDVNAYPDENKIKVTLESGEIELLNSADNSFNYKLSPGEMAEFESITRKVEIKTVESKDYANWKNGELIFVDTPLAEVFKRLERKFDIKIEVNNPRVYKSVFNAKFKNESLKEILDYIQFSCPVAYQLISEKETTQKKVIFN